MHRGDRGRLAAARGGAGARAGFTLIELSIVIIVIALLATIGVVVGSRVIRSGRDAAERQLLVAIRTGVDSFRMQFGFLPPLVVDGDEVPAGALTTQTDGPLTDPPRQPVVRSTDFINRKGTILPAEPRCSVYSIPYYLMGLLDMPDRPGNDAKPIDGVEGSGFTAPQPDGAFTQRGAPIPPLVDTGTIRGRIWRNSNPTYAWQVVVQDRWATPIRYYRWGPRFKETGNEKGQLEQYFVPRAVGDPAKRAELRSAEYAIVSLGADRKTDDRLPLPTNGVPAAPQTDPSPIDDYGGGDIRKDTQDDIVEVGR